jgi:hypothetical protein
MEKRLGFLEDIFWGVLPVVGVLAGVGLLAVVMRLSLGKW